MDQSPDSMLTRYFRNFLPDREFILKDGKAISKKWLTRKEFFSNLKYTNTPEKIIDIFSKSITSTKITTFLVYNTINTHYDIIKKYEQIQYINDFLYAIMDPIVGKELKSQKDLHKISGIKTKTKTITSTFVKRIVLLYDIDSSVTQYFDDKSVLFLLEKYAQLFDGKTLNELKSDNLDLSWFTDENLTSWLDVKLNFKSFQELIESMSMYNKALFYETCSKWAITPGKQSRVNERLVDAAILNLVNELESKGFDVSVESKVKDIISLAVENNIHLTDTVSEKIKCYLNEPRKINNDLLNIILAKADGTIYPDLIDSYKAGENPIHVAKKIIFRAEQDKILDMELSKGEFKHSIEKTLASILQVYINPYLTKSTLTVSNLLDILKSESLENPAYYSIKPRDVKQDIMNTINTQNKKINKELGCTNIDMSKLDKLKEKFKRVPKLNKNPKGINDFNYVRSMVRDFFKMSVPSTLPEDLYTDILNIENLNNNIERRFVTNVLNLVSFDEYIKEFLTYDEISTLKTQEDIREKASKIVDRWNAKVLEKVDIKKSSRKLQHKYYYQRLEQELYEDSLENGKLDKSVYYDKCSYPIFLILGNTFTWFKKRKESEKYQILLHTIRNKSFTANDKNDSDVEISYIPEYTQSSVDSARIIFRKKYLESLLQGHILFNNNIYHIYATLIPVAVTVKNQHIDIVDDKLPNYNVKTSHHIKDKKLILLMNGDLYHDNNLIRQNVEEIYLSKNDDVLLLYLDTGRYLFSYLTNISTILPLNTNITEVELLNDSLIFTVDDKQYNFDDVIQLKKGRKANEKMKTVSDILSSNESDLKIVKDLLYLFRTTIIDGNIRSNSTEITAEDILAINDKISTITTISSSDYYKRLIDILMPFFEFSNTSEYFHVPIDVKDHADINVSVDVIDFIDYVLYELFYVMNPISSYTFILDSFIQDVRNALLLVHLKSYPDKSTFGILSSDYNTLSIMLEKLKSVSLGKTELTSYYSEQKKYYHLTLQEYVQILKTLDKFPDKFKVPFITFFKNINPEWFKSEKMNLLMDLTTEIEELEKSSPTSEELEMKKEDRLQLMKDMNESSKTMKWDTSSPINNKKFIKHKTVNKTGEKLITKPSRTYSHVREKVQNYLELLSAILESDNIEIPKKHLTFMALVQEYLYKTTSSDSLFRWVKNKFKVVKYHFKNTNKINHLYKQLDRVIMEKTNLSLDDLYYLDHGNPPSMAAYRYNLENFIEYLENVNISTTSSAIIENIYFTATRMLLNDGKYKTENFKNKQYIEIMTKIMDLYLSMGGYEFIENLKNLKMHPNQHIITDRKNKNVQTLLTMLESVFNKGFASESEINKMVDIKNSLTKISEKDYIVLSGMIDKFLTEQYSKSQYYNSLLRYIMKLRYKITMVQKNRKL